MIQPFFLVNSTATSSPIGKTVIVARVVAAPTMAARHRLLSFHILLSRIAPGITRRVSYIARDLREHSATRAQRTTATGYVFVYEVSTIRRDQPPAPRRLVDQIRGHCHILSDWNNWRPRPESNRGKRICSPVHHHSATRPLKEVARLITQLQSVDNDPGAGSRRGVFVIGRSGRLG